MPLNEHFLQELKYKTDIEEVISSYISLKKRGSTSVGLCPFHNEKTPSFTVYNDTQSFYCFGCGAGGDAVGFIRKIENLDYIDAIKLLAQRAGMQMPDDGFDDSLSKKRRRILEINRESARFFHSCLMSQEGEAGLNYFLNRGLSLSTIKKFGLGYAPDKWDSLLKHLKSLGFTFSEMLDAGVIKLGKSNRYYDTFKNRVMTPIIDVRGNVIAFGGRVLDDSKPKYVNTSETLVYKKTYELFSLNNAKDSGEDYLILCEGYMDVIAMYQAGFKNAVAGCGTALTPEQVRLISRYTNEVVLAYDNDDAGQKALAKAVRLFRDADVKVRIPNLSGGKDPDEIIKKLGRDKFKGMLDGASNEIEFSLFNIKDRLNINTSQGKIDYINAAIKILSDVSPIEQDIYLSRIADELEVDKSSIKLQLDAYIKRKRSSATKQKYNKIVDNAVRHDNQLSMQSDISIRQMKAEERILGLLFRYPDCSRLCKEFDGSRLSKGFVQKAYGLIVSRIDDGLDVDLINFGDSLTMEEFDRLSGIIAKNQESKDSKKEFTDCISIINEEYDRNNKLSLSDLTEDEFRKLFNKNT